MNGCGEAGKLWSPALGSASAAMEHRLTGRCEAGRGRGAEELQMRIARPDYFIVT